MRIAAIPAWNMEYGDVVSKALGDAAYRVLRAGAILHGCTTKFVASSHAGITIRHVECVALLTDDEGSNSNLGGCFDQVAVWKCRKDFYTFELENVSDEVCAIHLFVFP